MPYITVYMQYKGPYIWDKSQAASAETIIWPYSLERNWPKACGPVYLWRILVK